MQIAGIFFLPNATFFVELGIFLIIVFIVSKFILPILNKAMQERQEHIRSSLEAADKALADASETDDARRELLEAARHQGREILASANETAEKVRVDAQARAQVEFDRIVSHAETELALARQRAVEESSQRMGELVIEVVERIIGREIDVTAHQDLIDQAIGVLVAEADGSNVGTSQSVGASSKS